MLLDHGVVRKVIVSEQSEEKRIDHYFVWLRVAIGISWVSLLDVSSNEKEAAQDQPINCILLKGISDPVASNELIMFPPWS